MYTHRVSGGGSNGLSDCEREVESNSGAQCLGPCPSSYDKMSGCEGGSSGSDHCYDCSSWLDLHHLMVVQ